MNIRNELANPIKRVSISPSIKLLARPQTSTAHERYKMRVSAEFYFDFHIQEENGDFAAPICWPFKLQMLF